MLKMFTWCLAVMLIAAQARPQGSRDVDPGEVARARRMLSEGSVDVSAMIAGVRAVAVLTVLLAPTQIADLPAEDPVDVVEETAPADPDTTNRNSGWESTSDVRCPSQSGGY